MSLAKNITKQDHIFHKKKELGKSDAPESISNLDRVRDILMGEEVKKIHSELDKIQSSIHSLLDAQKKEFKKVNKELERKTTLQSEVRKQDIDRFSSAIASLRKELATSVGSLQKENHSLKANSVTKLQFSSLFRSLADTVESTNKG